jgi:protein-L-isoaspartate(D-aspartate) O-methyltransferase
MTNIQKNQAHFFMRTSENSGPRIIPITKDGLQGLAEHGPYDVIHVGAAVNEIPQCLLDQLAPGGMLWAPVTESFAQAIYVYTKSADGQIVEKERLF